MPTFNETVENIAAEEASVGKLFGGDGTRVRKDPSREGPQYLGRLREAAEFVADVASGRRPMHHLQEAMSTSDFPLLFADVLDRQLLASYQETEPVWQNFCRRSTVPDFRSVKRFAVDGAEAVLPAVAEREEYPEASLSEAQDTYSVSKYGRRLDLSWEAIVNDDLDAFRRSPERLARAARRSEDRFATELFADSSGPHASLYTAGYSNIVTGNPAVIDRGVADGVHRFSRSDRRGRRAYRDRRGGAGSATGVGGDGAEHPECYGDSHDESGWYDR